jgi:hypothetical protein
MSIVALIYVFSLFYIFIPGNVFELPFKVNKMIEIVLHALIFSVILTSTYDLVNAVNILGL